MKLDSLYKARFPQGDMDEILKKINTEIENIKGNHEINNDGINNLYNENLIDENFLDGIKDRYSKYKDIYNLPLIDIQVCYCLSNAIFELNPLNIDYNNEDFFENYKDVIKDYINYDTFKKYEEKAIIVYDKEIDDSLGNYNGAKKKMK